MQLDRQREACNELESLLEMKIREHEAQEVQFTAEHEEEVRALRQQKQQLMEKLDESKEHFENILESQDEEVRQLQPLCLAVTSVHEFIARLTCNVSNCCSKVDIF